MFTRKVFLIILIESILIILLSCGIFFVTRHYKSKADKKSFVLKNDENNSKHKRKSNIENDKILSVPVEAKKAVRKSMNIFLTSNCNIEAEKEVDIISKTSGEVIEISVEEGEHVSPGNILVLLDKEEASLELREAHVKLENTKLLYERSQKTFRDKITSKEEFDEHKLNYQMAQVEYEKRKLELGYYSVRSPIEGTIVERFIEVGDNIQEGETLFKLAKLDRIFAKIYIPEKDLNKVKQGQTSYVSVESIPNLRFEGIVKLINPVIDSNSGTIKVTIEIKDNNLKMLRPGMFATVHVIVDHHTDAIVIPKKAIVADSIVDEVFIIKELVKTGVSNHVVKTASLRQDVTIELKSLLDENQNKKVLQKSISGKIVDIKDNSSIETNSSSNPANYITIELNEISPFPLDEKVANINILDNNGTKYLDINDAVLNTETIAYKTQIELGFSESNEVETLSGITENDMIVVSGLEDLIQGSRVSIVSD